MAAALNCVDFRFFFSRDKITLSAEGQKLWDMSRKKNMFPKMIKKKKRISGCKYVDEWRACVCVCGFSAQIGMWSEFLAELKDAAGVSGTPAYTSMPAQVSTVS